MDDATKENGFRNTDHAFSSALREKRLSWNMPGLNGKSAAPGYAGGKRSEKNDGAARALEPREPRQGAAANVLKTQLRDLLDDFTRTREQLSQKFLEAECVSLSGPEDTTVSSPSSSNDPEAHTCAFVRSLANHASAHHRTYYSSRFDHQEDQRLERQATDQSTTSYTSLEKLAKARTTLQKLGDFAPESGGHDFPAVLMGAGFRDRSNEGQSLSFGAFTLPCSRRRVRAC